jgi:hypothetical protein
MIVTITLWQDVSLWTPSYDISNGVVFNLRNSLIEITG